MPKKIRELKNILRKAGFSEKSGKGSHTKWTHPLLSGTNEGSVMSNMNMSRIK